MHGLITLAAAAQTSVVVMTWGGPFMDALNEVRPDIEKSTGTKIEFVTQANAVSGLQRLEAQKANPQVDLWTTSDATAAAALANGIVEPIPAAEIINLKDIPEKLIFPAGPAIWSPLASSTGRTRRLLRSRPGKTCGIRALRDWSRHRSNRIRACSS